MAGINLSVTFVTVKAYEWAPSSAFPPWLVDKDILRLCT